MFAFPIFGCVAASSSVAWTPADLAGIDFWLQPPPSGDSTNGGLLTIATGKVSDAADAAGSATVLSQATAGRRPVVGAAVDGFSTLDWAYADDVHIESATGGLSGDVDHTLIALIKITDGSPFYPAVGYGSFLCYGNPNGENSQIGVQSAAGGSWWGGGGASHGTGTGGPALGKALDQSWHLLTKVTASNVETICIDGVEIYSGDTSTAPAAGYLGSGRWLNNSSYTCSSHRSLDKLWVGQACTDAEIRQVADYLNAQYPTTYGPMLVCVGDSLSSGYLLGTPSTEAWPAIVAASRNYQLRQHAYPGWRTYWAGNPNIRDGGNSLPTLAKDGLLFASIITDWSGINDVNNAITNATLKGYKETNIAAIRAKNPDAKLVGFTLLPSLAVVGSEETERAAHNTDMKGAWGAAQYDQIVDLEEIAALLNPADTTYYNVDGTHLNATGQALVAAKFLAEVT